MARVQRKRASGQPNGPPKRSERAPSLPKKIRETPAGRLWDLLLSVTEQNMDINDALAQAQRDWLTWNQLVVNGKVIFTTTETERDYMFEACGKGRGLTTNATLHEYQIRALGLIWYAAVRLCQDPVVALLLTPDKLVGFLFDRFVGQCHHDGRAPIQFEPQPPSARTLVEFKRLRPDDAIELDWHNNKIANLKNWSARKPDEESLIGLFERFITA